MLAAAFFLAWPGGATAASTASATMTDISFQFIDLDPTDSFAPGISAYSLMGAPTAVTSQYSLDPASSSNELGMQIFAGWGLPASAASTGPAALATATLTRGTNGPAGSAASTFAYAGPAGESGASAAVYLGDGFYSSSAGYGGYIDKSVPIGLTPETIVLMHATVGLSVAASLANVNDDASATAELGFYTIDDGSNPSAAQTSSVSFQVEAGGSHGAATDRVENLTIAFVNASPSYLPGWFHGDVQSHAIDFEPASAVPEPAASALLAMGLAAIGLVVRRRGRGLPAA